MSLNTETIWGVQDIAHRKINKNRKFFSASLSAGRTTTGGNTDLDFNISTTGCTDKVHFQAIVQSNKDALFKFVEAITTTGGAGTGVTAYNHDRNSTNAAALVVKHTPTASTTGASAAVLASGHVNNYKTYYLGGENHQREEWVLKTGTQYLLRVTAEDSTCDIYTNMKWYEES